MKSVLHCYKVFLLLKLQFLSISLVLTPPRNISLASVSKEGQPESREMSFN